MDQEISVAEMLAALDAMHAAYPDAARFIACELSELYDLTEDCNTEDHARMEALNVWLAGKA